MEKNEQEKPEGLVKRVAEAQDFLGKALERFALIDGLSSNLESVEGCLGASGEVRLAAVNAIIGAAVDDLTVINDFLSEMGFALTETEGAAAADAGEVRHD